MRRISSSLWKIVYRAGWLTMLAGFLSSGANAAQQPLKALFLTGGGYHDYQKLAPHLTTNISRLVNVTFDVSFDLNLLKNDKFADRYDVVVYDLCFDEADSALLDNALKVTRDFLASGRRSLQKNVADGARARV